jgi:uncharacterized repeat protein (TIGR04138 family)
MSNNINRVIADLAATHGKYKVNAYYFIMYALRLTSTKISRKEPSHPRHLSGQELSNGIKEYALRRFGCLSYTVMTLWGVYKTDDFGAIVYHLIDAGLLGKSGEDSIEDFTEIFDFKQAFLNPWKP